MLFETALQARAFLGMSLAGVALGLLYDGLHLCKRIFAAGALMSGMLDMVYGLLLALILAVAVILVNDGQLRSYLLLGTGCGALLYAQTARKLWIWIGHRTKKCG